MTYCLGLALKEGLVMVSDSRTNAGADYATAYSKTHVFTPAPDRIFVLLSAGNLATTQEIINIIRRDLENPVDGENLLSSKYLFETADYVGRVSHIAQNQHAQALQSAGVSGDATLILGGQIMGQPHGLMMIYPQGNHIEALETTPYLQIGETKYGKPILDRVCAHDMPLDDAARLALVSLSSTTKSNTTVGPPFELSIYRKDELQLRQHCSFDNNHPFLSDLENTWRSGLQQVFTTLPRFDWEDGGNYCGSATDPGSDQQTLSEQVQTGFQNPGDLNS